HDGAAEEGHGAAVGADRRARAVHRQPRRAPHGVRPAARRALEPVLAGISVDQLEARRRVAEDQGRCRRSQRGARAARVSRSGGQMTGTSRPHNIQRRDRRTRREDLSLRFLRVLRLSSCLVVAVAYVMSGSSRIVVAQPQQQPPPPSFQSSVEVTSLDVTVVDDRGKPIASLAPADFVVRVDGNPRRVVTAEWVALSSPPGAAPVPAPPDGYSTNESATGGRLIVMAVDQPNIRFGGAMAINKAANAFIDRLAPSDRVAVAGFGVGAPSTPFTADRARIKRALARMV